MEINCKVIHLIKKKRAHEKYIYRIKHQFIWCTTVIEKLYHNLQGSLYSDKMASELYSI